MFNKYGARRTKCRLGHNHPSALEASVCEVLQMRVRCGDIRALKWQHTVHLGQGIKWKVDFSFEQSPDWHQRLAEAKGVATSDFKTKLRLYREGYGPAWPLELWYGSAARPFMAEVVWPKKREP